SFSAVAPGQTNSLTRHMSRAAMTGFCELTAVAGVPLAMRRTAITRFSASGLKAFLMPSSQVSGALVAVGGEAQATSMAADKASEQALRSFIRSLRTGD